MVAVVDPPTGVTAGSTGMGVDPGNDPGEDPGEGSGDPTAIDVPGNWAVGTGDPGGVDASSRAHADAITSANTKATTTTAHRSTRPLARDMAPPFRVEDRHVRRWRRSATGHG